MASHNGTGGRKMKPHNKYWQSTSKQMDSQSPRKKRIGKIFLHQKAGNCWVSLWQSEARAFASAFFSSSLRSARGLREKKQARMVTNQSKTTQRQAEKGQSMAWEWPECLPVVFPGFLACIHNAGRLKVHKQL